MQLYGDGQCTSLKVRKQTCSNLGLGSASAERAASERGHAQMYWGRSICSAAAGHSAHASPASNSNGVFTGISTVYTDRNERM